MEPAIYDQEPSRISTTLSSHLIVEGISPPLLQNPSPTLCQPQVLNKKHRMINQLGN